MNIKKTVTLLFFSFSLCLGQDIPQRIKNYFKPQHPAEKMYQHIVKKIPNLTKLIEQGKYNKINFDSLYKSFYLLDAFNIWISQCADQTLVTILIEQNVKQKAALSASIITNLEAILQNPKKLNTYQPLLPLLDLAIGPQPSLLDLQEMLDNDIQQSYFNREAKETFGRHYTKLIESMYKTYIGIQNESQKKETVNNIYLEQSLHYGQQAYKTMKKHQLPLVFDEITDQVKLIEWLTQPEPSYTKQLIQKTNLTIEKKLNDAIKKIQQKIASFKLTTTEYQTFINDFDYHANMITTLFNALHAYENINATPDKLKTFIQLITQYLNKIEDSQIVDLLPEANLFRSYKNFLIQTIETLLNGQSDNFKDNFQPKIQLAAHFSDAKINDINLFINKWMIDHISFKKKYIPLIVGIKKETQKSLFEEEIILQDLSAQSSRTLLFYAELIAQAYKPATYQWSPLNKLIKQDLLDNQDNIFAFWQKEITNLYSHWLLDLFNEKNEKNEKKPNPQAIKNYFFTYTTKSWDQQIKEHSPEMLDDFKKVSKFLSTSLDYNTAQIKILLKQIQKNNYAVTSIKWRYIAYWRLINNQTALDIVESNGPQKIIHTLDTVTNFLFSFSTYKITDQKSQDFIKLKNAVTMLIANMLALQNELYAYLTSVLYTQTPNPLYQAYIKTGQFLITAIQKVIDLTTKKFAFLDLKPFKKPMFNFPELDKQYENKKIFYFV